MYLDFKVKIPSDSAGVWDFFEDKKARISGSHSRWPAQIRARVARTCLELSWAQARIPSFSSCQYTSSTRRQMSLSTEVLFLMP